MASATVRVSAETHRLLGELASQEGKSIGATIGDLAARAADDRMLEGHADAMRRLRGDEREWAAWQAEQEELGATLADGLDGL
jgi:hypothetical protein